MVQASLPPTCRLPACPPAHPPACPPACLSLQLNQTGGPAKHACLACLPDPVIASDCHPLQLRELAIQVHGSWGALLALHEKQEERRRKVTDWLSVALCIACAWPCGNAVADTAAHPTLLCPNGLPGWFGLCAPGGRTPPDQAGAQHKAAACVSDATMLVAAAAAAGASSFRGLAHPARCCGLGK